MNIGAPLSKFFADRGTHLAAMIAYFALLSFVPLVFLALALLGLFGRADESSYLVEELNDAFPQTSIETIVTVVNAIQDNAAALGLVGGVFLIWSSLSLFSVLESAFNIVYGRPNRPFLRGKALAVVFMVALLVTLFVGLVVGTIGVNLLNSFAPGILGITAVAYTLSLLVSTGAVFVFLLAAYRFLTNVRLSTRDVIVGAAGAAVALQATFQVLPIFLRVSNHVPALQAFGGPALLLVWCFLLGNIIVLGAEVNYWLTRSSARGRSGEAPRPS